MSKQGLKEARHIYPHLRDRGSMWERSEVKKADGGQCHYGSVTSCPYNTELYVSQLLALTICVATLFWQAPTPSSV